MLEAGGVAGIEAAANGAAVAGAAVVSDAGATVAHKTVVRSMFESAHRESDVKVQGHTIS